METEHFLKCEFACHIKTSHQYPVQTAGSLIFCILITGRLFLSGNRKLQFLNKKTSDFGQVELWNLFQRDVTVGKLWTKYFSLGPRVKSNERFNIAVDTSQEKVIWAWWMQPPLLAQIIKPSPLWRGRELKHHGKENKKLIWSSVQRCRLINSDCVGSETAVFLQVRSGQDRRMICYYSLNTIQRVSFMGIHKKVRSSQVHRRCNVERKEFCGVWSGDSDESGWRPGQSSHDWEEIRRNKLDEERVGLCGGSTQSAEEILKYVSAKPQDSWNFRFV